MHDDWQRVHHRTVGVRRHCRLMDDYGQRVRDSNLIGAKPEALGERGNIGIRDPALSVRNALEVQD